MATLDELYQYDFWHCVRKSDYPDGVTVVCESFHQLLPRFQGKDKVLLVLDPPYLCARQESYKQAHYFDLIDFLLRFIHLVEPPYIFSAQQKASLSALLIISLRAKPITGKHLQIASVSQFKRRQAITVSMKII
ncbi:hypothetical protein A6046_06750 [[Haemophilus] ducreyi]|uniref:Uncharacterized protein n=1 Tax=Haemophilus ducreyi (strain 35000HP / ATCC 700724) TaxID=233412 RepID=Q7VNJ0_HAEDU|nr:hypothetical protein HD_0539 [[Haemophilus] ducreyi 35000HP]ANF65180.1 hypothetical protein A6039_06200 [[Haemophilus] ducreyi]ANF66058.1 hypothetical protein A6040_02655 [[Haemophilus] ducreyi]ANF70231.1 hypothetical protein A6043_02260 [[Haemophilus] ducreyi]ANF72585.1 hypothetical protein A6044_06870 [[Haemophilus] ducreyi]